MVQFSEALLRGINHVNGDVAHEMYQATEESIAEVCIDTFYLRNWGHPIAASEVSALIDAHGYEAVIAEAAKHVSLA